MCPSSSELMEIAPRQLYPVIVRLQPRLHADWIADRDARRAAIWRELTAPAMGHGALEALREERVKREMEQRVSYWLHKKGLSADPVAPLHTTPAMRRKAR